jgi:hypothetical protein
MIRDSLRRGAVGDVRLERNDVRKDGIGEPTKPGANDHQAVATTFVASRTPVTSA